MMAYIAHTANSMLMQPTTSAATAIAVDWSWSLAILPWSKAISACKNTVVPASVHQTTTTHAGRLGLTGRESAYLLMGQLRLHLDQLLVELLHVADAVRRVDVEAGTLLGERLGRQDAVVGVGRAYHAPGRGEVSELVVVVVVTAASKQHWAQ
jgi:hypothetical protein